jgi:hypothetical protein
MKYISKTIFTLFVLFVFLVPGLVFADQVSCGVDLSINPPGSYTVQADWFASVVGLGIYDIYLDTGSGLNIVGKFNPLVIDDAESGTEWTTFSTPGVKTFRIKSGPGCDNYYSIEIPSVSNPPLGTICAASNVPTSWVLYGPTHSIPYSGTSVCVDDEVGDWTIGDIPSIAGYDGPYLSPSVSTQNVQNEESISWNITYVPITVITNGSCGSAATSYPSAATDFSGSFCSSGNAFPSSPTFPNPGSSVGWSCMGIGGGSNDTCSADRAPMSKVDGICGSANRTYSYTETSYGSDSFCTTGILSPASPGFPSPGSSSSWSCLGQYGGLDRSCSASRELNTASVNVTVNNRAGGKVVSTPGGIDCGSTCSASYPLSSLLVLTEIPNSSYWKFDSWGGDCASFGRNKTCSLNLNSTVYNVTARFVPRIFDYFEF